MKYSNETQQPIHCPASSLFSSACADSYSQLDISTCEGTGTIGSDNTIKDRRYRGVGGISHGGGIAARMAFQFPETFGSLGILSRGIASVSADNLPRVRIDISDRDGILPFTQNLTSVLDQSQVPYTLNLGEGDHNWTFWSPLMEPYLLWFAEGWE